MSFMSVPKELRDDIKMIDSFGSLTVGLSNAGKVYVWGYTKLGTTKIDISDIPDEVKNTQIAYVSAGIDHIVAIGENGKVYAWGNNRLGQYGRVDEQANSTIIPMPDELIDGTIDVNNIKKLDCGYQATVILMKDGSYYIWGNGNAYSNMEKFQNSRNKFTDISFTLNNVVGVKTSSPRKIFTGKRGLYTKVHSDLVQGDGVSLSQFIGDRKITALVPSNNMICLLLDDGNVCFAGDINDNFVSMPKLAADEKIVDVKAGTYHFTMLTNKGNVFTIGKNEHNQCNLPKSAEEGGISRIYAGAFQSYAVDKNDDLASKWGLKGYLFGTGSKGEPILERVIHGGRMTMTVGAVAVIISTIIGIIIGCLSGYFGGKVDIFLMRVTEIVSAIPFLPFALLLSAVMGRMTISEGARIFIIMCILGVLSWPGLARLVRGQVLVARENEYVMAAKAMGVKETRIAFKHILPNVISVILVTLTLDFAGCMLTESSLSYLGFGVQAPRPTWGNMLNAASNSITIKNFWWQWFFPALFLSITTICINIIGDTIRDAVDPKSNSGR